MLYVSTRNNSDAYTAYRALHECNAPDGGYYFPFRLPHLSADELYAIKKQGPGETVAYILTSLNRMGCGVRHWSFPIPNCSYELSFAYGRGVA